jgi:hypothetical protein
MASRYDNRFILKNNLPKYQQMMKERGVKFIRQYNTPTLPYPDGSQISKLTRIRHIWKSGDRFYKLAGQYYENPTYWWVIAWYNQAPTEAHIPIGKQIFIPLPLQLILEYYSV